MINHHPKLELLQLYVNGDLPASLAAGISIHSEMCEQCRNTIYQLTEQKAEACFEPSPQPVLNEEISMLSDEFDFESMIDNITESDDITTVEPSVSKTLTFKNATYTLPHALNNMAIGRAANIGKLARSRVDLNEDEIHTNLLHIEPGGGVPEHTHKGFELTVLLEGSFHDENGTYEKGDFIMLDGSVKHHPVSENGCLCFTVANDALHFTQGINKLLNPIGSLIY